MAVCECEACTCEVGSDGDRCSEACSNCDENAEVCLCGHDDCAGGEVEEELFDETEGEDEEEET